MNSSTDFDGRVALVTGAARGIGLGIARRLAAAGARVIVADLDRERGAVAVADLCATGLRADFLAVDLAVSGGPAAMVRDALALTGRLDLLVNNARAGRRLSFLEETEANWDLGVDVGLKAAFFATQAAVHALAQHRGSVINIASVAGTQVTNEAASYHAAKAGLLQLTRYLAVAAGPHGVRVNAVLPGLIVQTEHRPRFDGPDNGAYRSLASTYQPLGDAGSEDDVAEAVLFLGSPRARYVSGACLTLDGGATVQEPFGLLLRHARESQAPLSSTEPAA